MVEGQQRRDTWRRLAKTVKDVGYGRIIDLPVRCGVPDLSKPITIEYFRLLKPGRKALSKPGSTDVEAKAQFRELRNLCECERDFVITDLQIQDGLPHSYKCRKERMI